MRSKCFLPFVCLGVALLLNGCAAFPRSGAKALAGTWVNPLGTVWTINEDGTFHVDLDKDGKRDAWGKYTTAGNRMTICEESNKVPRVCHEPAIYEFRRTAKSLHLTLVKDRCDLRVKHISLAWTRR